MEISLDTVLPASTLSACSPGAELDFLSIEDLDLDMVLQ